MNELRHNYEYDIDVKSESAPANVVRLVGENKRVLEIGCGPGSIAKILSKQSNCRITGVELDLDAIAKATPYCENIIKADLNSIAWPTLLDGLGSFDVVLAADVLEHLYDPWNVLQLMSRFITPSGYIVVSLPHVGHAAVISCLINGDFQYRNSGLLDRTHIRFFGLANIEDLFKHAGLKIVDVRYVRKPPEETELADSWSKVSFGLQKRLTECAHSDIYQVVVKSVPLHFEGLALSLNPPRKTSGWSLSKPFTIIRKGIARRLNPEVKTQLEKLFRFLGITFS